MFVFVIIILCGTVLGDVSQIIKPSREYLPPSREYLPPASPKQFITSTLTPTITTSYQNDLLSALTPLPAAIAQDIVIQSAIVPEIKKTIVPAISDKLTIEKESILIEEGPVSPVVNTVSYERKYPSPLITKPLAVDRPLDLIHNERFPPLTSVATPNEITIYPNGNQKDSELITNNILQPTINTYVISTNSAQLTTSKPPAVTVYPETTQHNIQKTTLLTQETPAEKDPLIRINASELSESIDEISELPSNDILVSSTPDTILSADGYHYSIPLVSFANLNKK